MEDETIYSNNPLEIAERWVKEGAKRLHIVDLNGAMSGKPVNADIIHNISETLPNIEIQVGGGIRDEDTIQTYLDAGVNFVIIGTRAVTTPHFVSDVCLEFPGHIIVGLDARNGKLATEGWSKLSNHDVVDIAQRFEDDGVASIIFTDIGRDGMMSAVNIDATLELCRQITVPVIASGGISGMDDIKYEGSLDHAAAQKYVNENCGKS
jgi:phosphoribosylformimino-5-aminoimidazole carboxamide ribotide isomerase